LIAIDPAEQFWLPIAMQVSSSKHHAHNGLSLVEQSPQLVPLQSYTNTGRVSGVYCTDLYNTLTWVTPIELLNREHPSVYEVISLKGSQDTEEL
jgi:hypothetical protein